jgi:4-diphosphocytidyl-2-C-methyl-D-erythritol kinase
MPRPPNLHRDIIETKAFAKVNLALSVGAPLTEAEAGAARAGMHPIASWMARIDLADDLHLTRLGDGFLSRYAILWHDEAPRKTPIDWSITKDLTVRAHLLLEREAGRSLPVQLKIEKRIPVGGGLGGGSADAAAMMLAVREMFELDISDERLIELAGELGSDVAYFLGEGPAYVGGLGGEIERTPALRGDVGGLVLVVPGFGCSTGEVYRAFDDRPAMGLRADEVRAMARAGRIEAGALFNDLEDAAISIAPDLGPLFELVEGVCMGRRVMLSGSGSSVFVVCESGREASHLARAIEAKFGTERDLRTVRVSFV